MSEKPKAKRLKTYTASRQGVWVSLSLFTALILYFLYLFSNIPSDEIQSTNNLTLFAVYGITILVLLLVLYFVISNAYRSFLHFYEDGLELERGRSRLFCPWENLKNFGVYHTDNETRYGICFDAKRKPLVQGLLDRLFYGSASDFINLSPFTQIPSRSKGFWKGRAIDVESLRKTELGQDLYQFAPHLFNAEEKPKKLQSDETRFVANNQKRT